MQHAINRLLSLVIILATFVASCAPPPTVPVPTVPPKPAVTVAPPTAAPAAAPGPCKVAQVYTSPTNDLGWGYEHEHAFMRVKDKLGNIDLNVRKDSVADDNKTAVIDLLETMVQQGAKAVYTTSFGFMEPTREVAKKHPDVAFFHASGFPSPSDPPNIGYYFAKIEEGRYIAGEVAGLAVQPGAPIGYVAAHPIPEVYRGENAFALGIKATNPTAKVHNRWTLTWFDLDKEKNASEALLDPPVRANLISHHQDSVASLKAAEERGQLAIAYQSDQTPLAPKAILTGAVWHWDTYYEPTMKGVCSGEWLKDGKVSIPDQYKNFTGSMQDGMVLMAPLNTAPLASNPRKAEIEKLYADEVAAFKSGKKNLVTIFTGPIKDNEGNLKIEGKPDVAALYDERGQWFVDNIVGGKP